MSHNPLGRQCISHLAPPPRPTPPHPPHHPPPSCVLPVFCPSTLVSYVPGFEVTSLIELPPPGGIIALWAVVLPALYLLSTSITNLVLRDHSILKGPCPNCGTDNFTYFGDIFTGEACLSFGLGVLVLLIGQGNRVFMLDRMNDCWNVRIRGPCPNCGTDTLSYFGDIFTGEAWGGGCWVLGAARGVLVALVHRVLYMGQAAACISGGQL